MNVSWEKEEERKLESFSSIEHPSKTSVPYEYLKILNQLLLCACSKLVVVVEANQTRDFKPPSP